MDDFLERTQRALLWRWVKDDGYRSYRHVADQGRVNTWKGAADMPNTSLDDAKKEPAGQDNVASLRFVRRVVRCKPERASAKELPDELWLNAAT